MNFPSRYILLPLLIGVLVLPIPLLRDFHIESAMLAAVAGCFWAMWNGCKNTTNYKDGGNIGFILAVIYTAALPILLYSLFTGCLNWHGIGFWVLNPVPSIFFGYALGRFLRMFNVPYRRWIGFAILLFIAIGIWLIDFFELPQVYFFNHVWGCWPGPIYDETVKLSWSLVFYRGLTLAWVGLLWWIPAFLQSIKPKILVIVCSIFLVGGYSQLQEMGIITPRGYLQEQLGGMSRTDHFTIYYDQSHYTTDEIDFIAQKHEFYFQQITKVLNLPPDGIENIESYLYAHPWQKKKLVGAKFTSYVPVWLFQNQLHIAKPQIAGSLKHELVHVLSKQFGDNFLNAGWSIGLIEGLAVALAPDASHKSTIDQIVVSEKPYPTTQQMRTALSLSGFWGGRSGVNYTKTGSFVQFLLQNYSLGKFKKAYQTGEISASYKEPFNNLIAKWHGALDTVAVDSSDKKIAERLYGFPSLFEQKCPHVQSKFSQQWDQFLYFMAEKDTSQALRHLGRARDHAQHNALVKNRWAYLKLKMGKVKEVQQVSSTADSSKTGLLLFADAYFMVSKPEIANRYITEAAKRLKEQPEEETREALRVRQDKQQWNYHISIVYDDEAIADSLFKDVYHRTQVRAIQQAIMNEKWSLMSRYVRDINKNELSTLYFDVYLELIERLAGQGEHDVANDFIKRIKSLPLRMRYRQRLQQTEKFANYLR